MPDIRLVNVSKHTCKDLNLTIHDREVFVIVGPTGAGKTTLLNVIAGVTNYYGSVFIGGICVDKVTPGKRGVGYLFQGLMLFPHMTVESNIAFGLRVLGIEEDIIKNRVSSLMEMLHIKHLSNRYPHMLSGGEKKRVALARSLAPSPQILLLDEPTSSLDHQTAKYLRSELIIILKKLGITTIYITHDLREAGEIADRIAFMLDGKIEQVSEPKEFFFNPKKECVSQFVGMPNIIECTDSNVLASGLVEVISDGMRIVLPYDGSNIKKITIPPEDIFISDVMPPGPALNRFTGIVEKITKLNSTVRVIVSIGGKSLLAELPVNAFDELAIEEGRQVHVVIRLRRLRYVES